MKTFHGWGLKVAVWHGEAKTLYYVVCFNINDENWEILDSFPTREKAQEYIETYWTSFFLTRRISNE